MLYELRTYTLKPGTAPAAARDAAAVGRVIRGDNYGKLEGYWVTEIGPLNQVLHLWSYPSYDERARLRAELGKNKQWVNDYLPLIRDKLVRQDVRLMNGIIPPVKPAKEGNIYELRHYRMRPGGVALWVPLFTEGLKVREKYSKIVALFATEAGQPNEVCHIWAYSDLNARQAARAGAANDPGWKAFLAKSGELKLAEEMTSVIMLPASHSPLK